MKKLEKLQKKLAEIQQQINNVSFERKDTSYRRSGGYFGTTPADTSNVIVVRSFARTKHLNTYICVNQSDVKLVEELRAAETELQNEQLRLSKIADKKWLKTSIEEAKKYTDEQIDKGLVKTNYAKVFIEGNAHIYLAHPYYKHSDYNKSVIMPNTPIHRKVAQELNNKLEAAGLTINY